MWTTHGEPVGLSRRYDRGKGRYRFGLLRQSHFTSFDLPGVKTPALPATIPHVRPMSDGRWLTIRDDNSLALLDEAGEYLETLYPPPERDR